MAETNQHAAAGTKASLLAEIGQSFQLMGLMAAMLACYIGLGFLAVHVFA